MSFQVRDFNGAVQVKDGIMAADGRTYYAVLGKVSILSAEEMLGFDVNSNDSNWLARIESKDGTRSVNIPGCKVHAVLQGEGMLDDGMYVFDLE